MSDADPGVGGVKLLDHHAERLRASAISDQVAVRRAGR